MPRHCFYSSVILLIELLCTRARACVHSVIITVPARSRVCKQTIAELGCAQYAGREAAQRRRPAKNDVCPLSGN